MLLLALFTGRVVTSAAVENHADSRPRESGLFGRTGNRGFRLGAHDVFGGPEPRVESGDGLVPLTRRCRLCWLNSVIAFLRGNNVTNGASSTFADTKVNPVLLLGCSLCEVCSKGTASSRGDSVGGAERFCAQRRS